MISAFITITDPEKRGDTFKQCYESAKGFCDEIVVIDGKDTWPEEFDWRVIGEHFQRGYEQCTGDWVFHLDCDFIFHENNYADIRQACEEYPDAAGLSFWKYQIFTPDRYTLKSRLVLAVNKGKYGDRIRFDSGPDKCQPSVNGIYISPDDVPEARIPFYNYEKLLKTTSQIAKDSGRMDRAYHHHFGQYQLSKNGSNQSAYDGWYNMVKGRYKKHINRLTLEEQPMVIRDAINNLKPNQFGYNGFGLKES